MGKLYYVSHIVYRQPHNYQVILKVEFSSEVKARVASEMKAHASDQFIYLLDHMDISQIEKKPAISGQVFRRSADGLKTVIFENVGVNASDYSVIFFDEVPLSLAN